jgi:hypothetical protein
MHKINRKINNVTKFFAATMINQYCGYTEGRYNIHTYLIMRKSALYEEKYGRKMFMCQIVNAHQIRIITDYICIYYLCYKIAFYM